MKLPLSPPAFQARVADASRRLLSEDAVKRIWAAKVNAALRNEFGGHAVKAK